MLDIISGARHSGQRPRPRSAPSRTSREWKGCSALSAPDLVVGNRKRGSAAGDLSRALLVAKASGVPQSGQNFPGGLPIGEKETPVGTGVPHWESHWEKSVPSGVPTAAKNSPLGSPTVGKETPVGSKLPSHWDHWAPHWGLPTWGSHCPLGVPTLPMTGNTSHHGMATIKIME